MSDEQTGVESALDSAPVADDTSNESGESDSIETQDSTSNESSEASQAKQVLKDPTASKAEKKMAEKKLEKFKLKVYGRDVEEEIDLNNKEDLTRRFQKSAAADRTMQEASEIRKAAMDFIQQLKTNPRKILSDPSIGVDIKKFAEEILNEEIQEMEKSPEQREREKLQKELDNYKKREKENEEKSRQSEIERLNKQHEVDLETQISAALDIGGVPKSPKTVARIADYLIAGLNKNVEYKVADIVQYVKRDIDNELKDIMNSLSDDKLEAFLGKEVLGRLRKKNVAKVKAIETSSAIKDSGTVKKADTSDKGDKKIGYKSFFGF